MGPLETSLLILHFCLLILSVLYNTFQKNFPPKKSEATSDTLY